MQQQRGRRGIGGGGQGRRVVNGDGRVVDGAVVVDERMVKLDRGGEEDDGSASGPLSRNVLARLCGLVSPVSL